MNTDLMVIGAHPDDAELFCGGTIAKLVARGRAVSIVDLSRGERGSRGSEDERRAEAEEAARLLGTRRVGLDCGDTLIENTQENRLKVVRAIREHRPRVVLAHDPRDRHPDHRKAHELVKDAVFYADVAGIDTGQPRHRPSGLFYFIGNTLGETPPPQFAVDVTEFFDTKMASIRAFASQFHNEDYEGPETFIASERFWQTIEARARLAGALIGANLAEAFTSDTPLAIDDVVSLFDGLAMEG